MSQSLEDISLFRLLLNKVAAVFLEQHTASSTDITHWKGEDIVSFQEDLREKTQGSISEKWFYSYVKKTAEKLPRIDILNLLSQYTGYENWHAFKTIHSTEKEKVKNKKKGRQGVLVMILLAIAAFVVYSFIPRERTFHFCFVDADKKEPITDITIDIIVLNENESPFYTKTDSLGCFDWKTAKGYIQFIAQSPYHKNDTIYRTISGDKQQQVRLRTDDYALMLHYYGNNNVKDWGKRKKELNKLIADDVTILEFLPHQLGVTIYNKEEFITKLTTPTQSLQKLQIIETHYQNEKIVKLKFKIEQ